METKQTIKLKSNKDKISWFSYYTYIMSKFQDSQKKIYALNTNKINTLK